jgi:hypothetical protein
VSDADYTEWRARFGNSSGSSTNGALGSRVPEPPSLLLLLSGWTIFSLRKCSRK